MNEKSTLMYFSMQSHNINSTSENYMKRQGTLCRQQTVILVKEGVHSQRGVNEIELL